MLAQTDEAHPAQRTETKPFDPHAAHAPAPSAGPWFDLSGLLPPRLADNLGKHRYAVTIANDEARAFFDQGLIYAYGFNHFEALRAFRHAQTLDPECAMCFWGEAYVLGPNLNLPMEAGAAAMARTAAENAVAKAAKTTPKEQALAAAVLVRYAEPGERPELDRKYAEAMQRVAQSFPDDPDIATLAAESPSMITGIFFLLAAPTSTDTARGCAVRGACAAAHSFAPNHCMAATPPRSTITAAAATSSPGFFIKYDLSRWPSRTTTLVCSPCSLATAPGTAA